MVLTSDFTEADEALLCCFYFFRLKPSKKSDGFNLRFY
jgi:hypothetical protein